MSQSIRREEGQLWMSRPGPGVYLASVPLCSKSLEHSEFAQFTLPTPSETTWTNEYLIKCSQSWRLVFLFSVTQHGQDLCSGLLCLVKHILAWLDASFHVQVTKNWASSTIVMQRWKGEGTQTSRESSQNPPAFLCACSMVTKQRHGNQELYLVFLLNFKTQKVTFLGLISWVV